MAVFSKVISGLVAIIGRQEVANTIHRTVRIVDRIRKGERDLEANELLKLLNKLKALDRRFFDFIDDADLALLSASGLGFIEVKRFETYEDFVSHVITLEDEGRAVVLSRFPSTIYLKAPKTKEQGERLERIRRGTIHNQEFYPLGALIEFGFSPCTPYSCAQKIEILDRLIESFDGSKSNQLFFFAEDNLTTHAEIEILEKKNFLIMELPSPDKTYIFFENPSVVREIYAYFNNTVAADISGLASKDIVTLLRTALTKSDSTESLIEFYLACNQNTIFGPKVLKHLSPSVQQMIKAKC